MQYAVEIVSRAEKEFLRLPSLARSRIRAKILSLEEDPRPSGARKLRETQYYRLKAGDYRVIYSVDDENRIVRILSIGHRREVYR